MIDSHCHLDSPDFDNDRDAVIQRALDAGVELMVAIGTGKGPPDLEAGIRIADAHPKFVATVGVHPHDAAKVMPETLPHLGTLLTYPKVIAVGEIGLDYHYDFSPRDIQRNVFIEQLRIAAAHRKPIGCAAEVIGQCGAGPRPAAASQGARSALLRCSLCLVLFGAMANAGLARKVVVRVERVCESPKVWAGIVDSRQCLEVTVIKSSDRNFASGAQLRLDVPLINGNHLFDKTTPQFSGAQITVGSILSITRRATCIRKQSRREYVVEPACIVPVKGGA